MLVWTREMCARPHETSGVDADEFLFFNAFPLPVESVEENDDVVGNALDFSNGVFFSHERHVLGAVVGAPSERFLRWDVEFLDELVMYNVGHQVDRHSTLLFLRIIPLCICIAIFLSREKRGKLVVES